jgi:hypothetical protein
MLFKVLSVDQLHADWDIYGAFDLFIATTTYLDCFANDKVHEALCTEREVLEAIVTIVTLLWRSSSQS